MLLFCLLKWLLTVVQDRLRRVIKTAVVLIPTLSVSVAIVSVSLASSIATASVVSQFDSLLAIFSARCVR